MKVSKSGYYKWLKNKDTLNKYEMDRRCLGELIKDIHKRKPSYGYHRIRKIILDETGWIISDNLVHKVCKILKIKSKAKHYKYKKPGEESVKYENLIGYNWNTTRPFEKIVSDTTSFYFKKKKYDWTFYLDIFNNEIVGYDVRDSMCGNGIINHREALNSMLKSKIKKDIKTLKQSFTQIKGQYIPQCHLTIYLILIQLLDLCLGLVHQQIIQLSNQKMAGLRKKCILILT